MRESAPRHIEYVTVAATLITRTEKAFKVDSDELQVPKWIPRSCLETMNRIEADRAADESTFQFRIEENFARKEGLI